MLLWNVSDLDLIWGFVSTGSFQVTLATNCVVCYYADLWYIANISARGYNMSNDDDYLNEDNEGIILLSWFPLEMIWCIDTCAAHPCIIDELESNSDEVSWIPCDVCSLWYHKCCSGLSEHTVLDV